MGFHQYNRPAGNRKEVFDYRQERMGDLNNSFRKHCVIIVELTAAVETRMEERSPRSNSGLKKLQRLLYRLIALPVICGPDFLSVVAVAVTIRSSLILDAARASN
jgi:hypothetical protein